MIPMNKDPCTTISQNGPWDYNESWLLDVRFFAMREEKEKVKKKYWLVGIFAAVAEPLLSID